MVTVVLQLQGNNADTIHLTLDWTGNIIHLRTFWSQMKKDKPNDWLTNIYIHWRMNVKIGHSFWWYIFVYPSYLGYFYFLVSILIRLTRFMHLHLFEVNYPKEVWKIFIWLVEYFLLSSFLFWSRLTRWDFPRNPCNDFFFYNAFLSKFLHISKNKAWTNCWWWQNSYCVWPLTFPWVPASRLEKETNLKIENMESLFIG